jgi:hypothetical protein
LKAGTSRRRPISTSASSFNDTAVVLSAKEEEVRIVEEKVIQEEKINQVFLEVTDSCGFI